ncbi:Protein of uncharacterised function (DUF1642) [Niallia circulans]|uniref:DUF1642 domain-containing protein n=1 Tax=Niallia circulans TaxID=1397 RepID=UPI00077C4426|nr:DUF1642 domain-containing protein [Niallia circulans]MDR4318734.1 DUF1642 domain-containing protein [Niallia circulans]MED3839302.1 DUF1642 domain-containing protein [Niallia circulans]MED4245284.1 DUF1642 domain-containing protein [Niallia circulans]MED4250820.1 DUF1642 domain-containing protein [Niallia circulans]QKH60104.1 DUF1642 domain-containing protein [Niallia circulans]
MTNVKPTLPREVANAIESLRNEGRDNYSIIRIIFGTPKSQLETDIQSFAYEISGKKNVDLLMSALINGYEVEQSPEDKLREYYDKLSDEMNTLPAASHSWLIRHAERDGIHKAIQILGITIDGINS